MNDDAARFFELFRAFGRAPSPETYGVLFHPEGEVADAGMAAPTPAAEVGAAIAHVLRLMPDLRIDMRRYRARGDTVFVEASNRGTVKGTPVAWDAVYRVHLREGRVHRGRRFYDQAQVFRALRPDLGWLPQLAPAGHAPVSYGEIVHGAPADLRFAADAVVVLPDQRAPVTPAMLAAHLGSARLEAIDGAGDSAGDAGLAFVEWRSADLLGVDRLELRDGRIAHLQRYVDTLGLLARADPSVTALRAALLSNAG